MMAGKMIGSIILPPIILPFLDFAGLERHSGGAQRQRRRVWNAFRISAPILLPTSCRRAQNPRRYTSRLGRTGKGKMMAGKMMGSMILPAIILPSGRIHSVSLLPFQGYHRRLGLHRGFLISAVGPLTMRE